jgi:hypothetical protein
MPSFEFDVIVAFREALRVGGARWGDFRGGGTNPIGELLNKHTVIAAN